MRCKACNKVMDTPKNWLSETEPEDDLCSECVTAGTIDWNVMDYAFGGNPRSGITPPATDSEHKVKKIHLRHSFHEENP